MTTEIGFGVFPGTYFFQLMFSSTLKSIPKRETLPTKLENTKDIGGGGP